MRRTDTIKAETRALILNAASSLFRERGVEKSTIRDVAARAGVSPASVIVHFRNKTALLEAALSEDIAGSLAGALATLPGDRELQTVLLHMAAEMLLLYDRDRQLYRVLIRDTFFEPVQDSPIIARLDEEYFAFLVNLLEQEKQKGRVRAEIDTRLAASSLFFLYIGVLREFLRTPELSAEKALELLAVILEQYLTGIFLPGGKSNDPA